MLSRLWLLLLLSSVMSEQMDWGDNPYLVDESITIQGREHIKLAVVVVGGSIDLECQVAFTSEPVSKIRWKIEGKLTDDAENQTEEIKNGEIFVEAHLKIVNITADMDGSTVSCEYAKGNYGASVETVFRVFSAELDIPEDVCNNCIGDVKLTFKESKWTSPAEETVDEKIKAMIERKTNVVANDITVDEFGYSVNVHITEVRNNKEILDMQPTTKKDGIYIADGLSQCKTHTKTSLEINNNPDDIANHTENKNDWTIIGIVIGIGIVLVVAVIFFKLVLGKKVIRKRMIRKLDDLVSKRGMDVKAELSKMKDSGLKSSEEDEAGQLKEGEPGAFKNVEDEFANEEEFNSAKEDDELEESPPNKLSKENFCRCRSKCLRKPYCKCKAKSTLCKEACHPSNRKCINK